MAWIDYKKAYDMVPHSSSIIECLDLFEVEENIKSLLVNGMEKWKVMLCSANSEFGEVKIKWSIFQGDSLSPLVFVLTLNMLVMEKGKIVKSVGIELTDSKVIKSLQESYKHLGILEAYKFLEEKMKLNVSEEYIRRLRKVLKSRLNGGI